VGATAAAERARRSLDCMLVMVLLLLDAYLEELSSTI
jgi:hypothetical protein